MIFSPQPEQLNSEITTDKRVKTHSFVFWFGIAFVLLWIDQLSKWLAFRYTPILSFEKSFGLTQFKNDQFAFSLPVPLPLTYLIYAIVTLAVIRFLYKNWFGLSHRQLTAWVLIVAGGVSNVFERLIIGYVRDFIQVPFGGIINLADIYILVGIFLLLAFERKRDK